MPSVLRGMNPIEGDTGISAFRSPTSSITAVGSRKAIGDRHEESGSSEMLRTLPQVFVDSRGRSSGSPQTTQHSRDAAALSVTDSIGLTSCIDLSDSGTETPLCDTEDRARSGANANGKDLAIEIGSITQEESGVPITVDEKPDEEPQDTDTPLDPELSSEVESDTDDNPSAPVWSRRIWRGNPVPKITKIMYKFLFKIRGMKTYGLDVEKCVVVYCDPTRLQEAEQQLTEFHEKFEQPKICLVACDSKITPATSIDQSWSQHCMSQQQEEKPDCCCAIGLPVTIQRIDCNEPAVKPSGILGCCHSLLGIAHSIQAVPTYERNDEDVLVLGYELRTHGKFSAHLNANDPEVLGTNAVGILGETSDVSVTYLDPPQDVSAHPPHPLTCSKHIVTELELEAVMSKPVWKHGPKSGSTDGEIFLTDAGFELDSINAPKKMIVGCIAVVHHYTHTGQVFAQRGDSGSVVFSNDATKKEGKPLGAVSAVTNNFPVRKRPESSEALKLLEEVQDIDKEATLAHRNVVRAEAFDRRNGVTYVVPYCYQFEALSEKHNITVSPQ